MHTVRASHHLSTGKRHWRYPAFVCSLVALIVTSGMLAVWMTRSNTAQAADISNNYTWKPLKIGAGGWVTGGVVHPTTPGLAYVRTDVGGAYRWDENSGSWTQLLLGPSVPNPTESDYDVESVAVSRTNNQIVYLAVGSDANSATGRILKSVDRGASWTDSGQRWIIAGNGEYRTGGERLAVDPNNENVVYFGSRKEGLWVSTNGGNNWSQIPTSQVPSGSISGDHQAGIKFVVIDHTSEIVNGKASRIYAGVTGDGIYMSNNGGSTWSEILNVAADQFPFDAEVASDGNFYVGIGNGTLQKYAPGSNSWTNISPAGNGGWYSNVGVDPTNPQRILVSNGAVRDGYVYRSTNGGANWTALDITVASSEIPWIVNTDEDGWMSESSFSFDPHIAGRVWFPQGTGVWRTTDINDSEITWNFDSKGIEEFVATNVIAPPGGQPVTTVMDRIGFYHSNPDSFPTKPIISHQFSSGWSVEYSGGTPSFVAAVVSDHRWLNPDLSGYSTDGGQTWSQFSGSRNYPDLYGGNIAISATNINNLVWLPTWSKKPYVSTDRGATWTKLNYFDTIEGLHTMVWWGSKRAMDADKVEGGVFYVYSTQNGGEFYRSNNNGQSWEKAGGTAPTSNGNDAHVFGQLHAVPGQAGHVWASVAQGGLHYSTNKGDTWTQVNGVQDARSFGFGKAIGSYPTVFVHGKVNDQWGIWRSTDQGATWDKVATHPAGIYDGITAVSGDMDIAGRVYVGFGGTGFVYGDSGSNPTPGGNGTGLKGEYFTNTTLSGSATLTRTDTQVNFDWGTGTPGSGIGSDNFSTRWTGQVQATATGNYILSTVSDDGVRLWVNGTQIINNWTDHAPTTNTSGSITLTGGQKYDIKMEYYERGGGALARLQWTPPGGSIQAIPQSQLYPASGGSGGTVTLNPTDDRDDWAENSGTSPWLNTSQWQTSYLKFNLLSVGNTVTSAKLRIYRPNAEAGSLTATVYQGNHDNWNESDNASLPGSGSSINSVATSTVGYIELDVTNFVQSQKSGDGVVTLALRSSSSGWQGFSSKDNATNKPELVVISS